MAAAFYESSTMSLNTVGWQESMASSDTDSHSGASPCAQDCKFPLNPFAPEFIPSSKMQDVEDQCRSKSSSVVSTDVESFVSDSEDDESDIEAIDSDIDLIKDIGAVLTTWVQQSALSGVPHRAGRFHSVSVPQMTIFTYFERLRKYFFCTDECFVMALAYMDRMRKADPVATVCDRTVHRLFLIATIVAAKYNDDVYYSNSYYAKVGGLSLKEVNALEATMLNMLDWNMHVTVSSYKFYYGLVCNAHAEC